MGLPRAPRAPLQPPRPQRVSDTLRPFLGEEGRPLVRPLGPRLSGLGRLGYSAGAEALGFQKRTCGGGVGRSCSWGGRRGTRGPTRSSHAACGSPQGSALLGFASCLHRVGLGDRRRLLRSLAGHPPSAPHLSLQDPRERSHGSRCWGPARIGLGASLGLSPAAPGSQPLRGGGLRPGSFGPRWGSSRSCSFLLSLHLLRFLNLFGAKSKFVFVHFCETSCRLF